MPPRRRCPNFDDSLYVTLSEVDFSTHEKKNSSPLVYKVAKIPLSYDPRSPKIYSVNGNKAGYTATLVACGWAGAVLEKVTRAYGQEPYA